MMRKLFGGTMAFSLVGSAVLGGVLAWQSYDEVWGSNEVGVAAFDADLDGPELGTLIGPNGIAKKVGHLDLTNNGTFDLAPGTNGPGVVQILSVENDPDGAPGPVHEGQCTSEEFENSGTRLKIGSPVFPTFTLSAGGPELDEALEIWIGVDSDAPNACQGDDVSWKAIVILDTVASGEAVSQN